MIKINFCALRPLLIIGGYDLGVYFITLLEFNILVGLYPGSMAWCCRSWHRSPQCYAVDLLAAGINVGHYFLLL